MLTNLDSKIYFDYLYLTVYFQSRELFQCRVLIVILYVIFVYNYNFCI